MYVNPDYTKNTEQSRRQVPPGSADAHLIDRARKLPTGIWLDSLAALDGGAKNAGRLSLTRHLDAALRQAAHANKDAAMLLVVYDLPNRDCAAAASNGELNGKAGLETYKHQYIDGIYQRLTAHTHYAKVRVAIVLEPDSLPNMVTNSAIPSCNQVATEHLYEDGVTYAIQRLGSLPNVALYLDIGHSGWLGWPDNMQKVVTLYTNLIKAATADHRAAVRGLATDIANYTPLQEPFVSPADQQILSGPFYQYNPVFDELTYVKALQEKFAAAGLGDLGFIIDTSRNGWKKTDHGRPIDGRVQRGNWCNVRGAGLGERPQAEPHQVFKALDAFYYVKPPGESDGASAAQTAGNVPDAEGKRFDLNCDPTNPRLDAMDGAPSAGHWFHAQFMSLLRNATPSL
jgi:cellulose 1,4-beta-cellobiosidase